MKNFCVHQMNKTGRMDVGFISFIRFIVIF
ncbi:hypothetical protein M527_13935 [Sphingobium indicum IP26]|nr:hypothetical protein M527_13935 [Sphingobium indicum IP26]EQA97524.1 hypothetical protein L286_22190 [Sphingobium sp. HDIP04]